MQRKLPLSAGDEESQHGLLLHVIKIDNRQRMPPCSIARVFSLLMLPFVFGLVALSVYSFWYFVNDGTLQGNIKMLVFHVLVLLLMISYLQTVFTDAGSVPMEWHNAVASQPEPGYPKCRKSKLFKPPRSHYDSMSQRLVLNEDHFCPWVANVVGFRNRKFFILFCCYTMLASAFAAAVLGPIALQKVQIKAGGSSNMRMNAVVLMAFILDCTFAFALCIFSITHIYMAVKNQTSIEDSYVSRRYDRGWRENLKTVFGSDWRLWALPIYGQGPMGDGVHWQLSDGTWDGFVDRLPPAMPSQTAAAATTTAASEKPKE